jgi:hypothetical protein
MVFRYFYSIDPLSTGIPSNHVLAMLTLLLALELAGCIASSLYLASICRILACAPQNSNSARARDIYVDPHALPFCCSIKYTLARSLPTLDGTWIPAYLRQ